MKLKIILILITVSWGVAVFGQPTITVKVSSDTIAIGDMVEVTYTIENGEGRFVSPDVNGLPVVSGPNSSSSFMIQNGKKTSSQSYSFILKAIETGVIEIPPASYIGKDDTLPIDPVTIVVLADLAYPNASSSPVETQTSKTKREKKKF